jgi:hypothetical protein
MKTRQIIKYVFFALLAVFAVGFLHYNLPRTDVVQITGTDVKRIDRGASSERSKTRDVRYLSTVTRDRKVRVFRNEDTGWGWPPYFKFNSADLTAKAQMLMQDPEKPWSRIRYYGWRIKIFSLFPNAISLKVVDKDYTHLPIFNIVFITLLVIASFVLWLSLRRFMESLRQSERYFSWTRSIKNRFGRGER